jgi:hypothetical protein
VTLEIEKDHRAEADITDAGLQAKIGVIVMTTTELTIHAPTAEAHPTAKAKKY